MYAFDFLVLPSAYGNINVLSTRFKDHNRCKLNGIVVFKLKLFMCGFYSDVSVTLAPLWLFAWFYFEVWSLFLQVLLL
jgi:hypothetical protein